MKSLLTSPVATDVELSLNFILCLFIKFFIFFLKQNIYSFTDTCHNIDVNQSYICDCELDYRSYKENTCSNNSKYGFFICIEMMMVC